MGTVHIETTGDSIDTSLNTTLTTTASKDLQLVGGKKIDADVRNIAIDTEGDNRFIMTMKIQTHAIILVVFTNFSKFYMGWIIS